jgi:hypothetical protein
MQTLPVHVEQALSNLTQKLLAVHT